MRFMQVKDDSETKATEIESVSDKMHKSPPQHDQAIGEGQLLVSCSHKLEQHKISPDLIVLRTLQNHPRICVALSRPLFQ